MTSASIIASIESCAKRWRELAIILHQLFILASVSRFFMLLTTKRHTFNWNIAVFTSTMVDVYLREWYWFIRLYQQTTSQTTAFLNLFKGRLWRRTWRRCSKEIVQSNFLRYGWLYTSFQIEVQKKSWPIAVCRIPTRNDTNNKDFIDEVWTILLSSLEWTQLLSTRGSWQYCPTCTISYNIILAVPRICSTY